MTRSTAAGSIGWARAAADPVRTTSATAQPARRGIMIGPRNESGPRPADWSWAGTGSHGDQASDAGEPVEADLPAQAAAQAADAAAQAADAAAQAADAAAQAADAAAQAA